MRITPSASSSAPASRFKRGAAGRLTVTGGPITEERHSTAINGPTDVDDEDDPPILNRAARRSFFEKLTSKFNRRYSIYCRSTLLFAFWLRHACSYTVLFCENYCKLVNLLYYCSVCSASGSRLSHSVYLFATTG